MLKKFLFVILIDIILIALWSYWANSIHVTQGSSIGIILIVPFIILLSGVAGLILSLRNNSWGSVILTNLLIGLAIFFGVFKYQFWKQQYDNYQKFYFSDNDKVYSVTLNLNNAKLENGLTYSIYERLGEYGNQVTDLDGRYIKKGDSLILTSDKGKVMKIFEMKLLDYPQSGDFVDLRNNPD